MANSKVAFYITKDSKAGMQSFVKTLQSLRGQIDNTYNVTSAVNKDMSSVLLRLVNGEKHVAHVYSHAVCGHHLLFTVDGVI